MKKTRGLATLGEGPNGQAPSEIHQLQELWLVLARREWTSIVLLPAGPDGSTADLARSLAEVGKNLSDVPVSAVTVRMLGPGSARALAALANHLRGGQKRLWRGGAIEVTPVRDDEADGPLIPAVGQVILGVPSVVSEPLSLAVAQAADGVVLGVELGRTRMRDLRRSVKLIGRERIVGCILV